MYLRFVSSYDRGGLTTDTYECISFKMWNATTEENEKRKVVKKIGFDSRQNGHDHFRIVEIVEGCTAGVWIMNEKGQTIEEIYRDVSVK